MLAILAWNVHGNIAMIYLFKMWLIVTSIVLINSRTELLNTYCRLNRLEILFRGFGRKKLASNYDITRNVLVWFMMVNYMRSSGYRVLKRYEENEGKSPDGRKGAEVRQQGLRP